MRDEIDLLDLVDAAAAVRGGRISCRELTEHYLRRIEETEPRVNAYATVTEERARRDARWADDELLMGRNHGPLHGVPIGIKDLLDTAGIRTCYGSARYRDQVPASDASAVAALRAAGTVLLGKHATQELAWGARTDSALFGPTHNPYRRGHIPGGSSGGSAASIVAGSSLGSIGTDTAGSVRIPAALCGCVGFKPRHGGISLEGVLPLAPSLDHVGVLARSVNDARALTGALIAPTRTAQPRGGPRVGWLGGWFEEVLAPGVRDAVATGRRLIEEIRPVDDVIVTDEPITDALMSRILAEAGRVHRSAFDAAPELYGDEVRKLMGLRPPSEARLAEAAATIDRFSAVIDAALADHDVLACATVPITAPPIGEMHPAVEGTAWSVEKLLTRLTAPFNASGHPAISVPLALDEGLPVGLQLIGRPGEEDQLFRVARLFELARGDFPLPDL